MKISRLHIFKNGTKANASEVNAELDQLLELINGQLDSDNIRNGTILKEKLAFYISEYYQDPVDTFDDLAALSAKNYEVRLVRDDGGGPAMYLYDPALIMWRKLVGAKGPFRYDEVIELVDQLNLKRDKTDGIFEQDVTVKKALPEYNFDAGRTNKSRIFWNANETGDYGFEVEVDGAKAIRSHKNNTGRTLEVYQNGAYQKLQVYADYINVLDYEVTGDGVTNDTNAINYLIQNTDEGKTIFFPAGTYLVSEILLTKKVHIVGAGRGTIFKRMDETNSNAVINVEKDGQKIYNLNLLNFCIDGNKDNNISSTGNSYGLWVKGCENPLLENIFSYNNRSTGFVLDRNVSLDADGTTRHKTSNGRIVDCWTHNNNGSGIYLGPTCVDMHVDGGDHGSNQYVGIDMLCPSSSIRDTVVWATREGSGVRIGSGAPSCQIFNVTSEGNAKHGIIVNSDFNIVEGCKVYCNANAEVYNKLYDGIFVQGTAEAPIKNILLSNNIIYDQLYLTNVGNNRNHIRLEYHEDVHIFGNAVQYLGGKVKDNTVLKIFGMNETTKTDYSWYDSYVQASMSGALALSTTWTTLSFATIDANTESDWNGTKFTPKYKGKFSFDISVMLDGTNAGLKMLRMMINKSGVETEKRIDVHNTSVTGWDMLKGTITLDLEAGDEVRFEGYSNSADSTMYGRSFTNLTIKLVK